MMDHAQPQQNAPQAFALVDLAPIHRGNLVARVKLEMPSGLLLSCNVLKGKPADSLWITPVAERTQAGYQPVVDFATPAVRDGWQAAALAALRPRWAELTQPAQPNEERFPRYDANF